MNATPNTLSSSLVYTPAMRRVLDHDCARQMHIVCARPGQAGNYYVATLARITTLRSRAGVLTVIVESYDYGDLCALHVGKASGYGYDKLSAAIDGFTVMGHTFTDDGFSVRHWAASHGWDVIGWA